MCSYRFVKKWTKLHFDSVPRLALHLKVFPAQPPDWMENLFKRFPFTLFQHVKGNSFVLRPISPAPTKVVGGGRRWLATSCHLAKNFQWMTESGCKKTSSILRLPGIHQFLRNQQLIDQCKAKFHQQTEDFYVGLLGLFTSKQHVEAWPLEEVQELRWSMMWWFSPQ